MKALVGALREYCLEKASLLYVFLPCLLFCGGWLKPLFAVPACLILLAGVYAAVRSLTSSQDEEDQRPAEPQNRAVLAIRCGVIAGLVVFVVAYSGIGGYSFQVGDYAMKHNSFMKDFIEYPWPLGYEHTGPHDRPGPLVTYVAFYLPSALVGKVLGWKAANFFSLVWAMVGLYLIVMWFLRLVGKVSVRYTLLFLFFGGLDVIGWVVLNSDFFPIARHRTLDYWVGYGAEADPAVKAVLNGVKWFYHSNMTFLYQSCHHLFPGSIIALMIANQAIRRRSVESLLFLWAATPLGSVFAAIGMAPYLLVSLATTRCRNLLTFQNVVAAPMLLLISGLFFLSNSGEYPHGWLWEFQDLRASWIFLLLFCLVEFGVYVAACPVNLENPGTRPARIWWWTAIACLALLPFYRLGKYSDLTAKAALPSLLMLQVYLMSTIHNATTRSERNAVRLLVVLLLIGTVSSVNELTRGLSGGLRSAPPPQERVRHVGELPGKKVATQLFGDPEAFFWRYLAKPLDLQ